MKQTKKTIKLKFFVIILMLLLIRYIPMFTFTYLRKQTDMLSISRIITACNLSDIILLNWCDFFGLINIAIFLMFGISFSLFIYLNRYIFIEYIKQQDK